MAKTFKTMVELQGYIESLCAKAIQDTAQEAKDELYRCVDEQYYKDPEFYPSVYQRTETFLSHVASRLLSSNSAEIYIDVEGMHYKNGFNAWQVVSWASESKHGADYYQTSTEDFWTTFIEWCNANLIVLLKKNLRKYGLKTR